MGGVVPGRYLIRRGSALGATDPKGKDRSRDVLFHYCLVLVGEWGKWILFPVPGTTAHFGAVDGESRCGWLVYRLGGSWDLVSTVISTLIGVISTLIWGYRYLNWGYKYLNWGYKYLNWG